MKKQVTYRLEKEVLEKLEELQEIITPKSSKPAILEEAINQYYKTVKNIKKEGK